MKKVINCVICDLCGKELQYYSHMKSRGNGLGELEIWEDKDGHEIKRWEKEDILVRFMTEQNEGRFVKPYLQKERIDICPECRQHLIDTLPIEACGAMGYNEYRWADGWKENEDDEI